MSNLLYVAAAVPFFVACENQGGSSTNYEKPSTNYLTTNENKEVQELFSFLTHRELPTDGGVSSFSLPSGVDAKVSFPVNNHEIICEHLDNGTIRYSRLYKNGSDIIGKVSVIISSGVSGVISGDISKINELGTLTSISEFKVVNGCVFFTGNSVAGVLEQISTALKDSNSNPLE